MKVIPTNFAAGYAARSGGSLMLAVVGRDLRDLYDAQSAPVPQEIAALLSRLGQASGSSEPSVA